MTATGPSVYGGVEPPGRERAEEHERRRAAAGASRANHMLLVGPGDRVEHGDDDRDQGQPDHDQQEGQVAEALALGDADGHVAEHAGDGDQPEDAPATRPSALRTSRSRASAPMA